MRWLLAIVLLSSLSIGCRSQNSTVNNPFLGRTTVPPPGTGLQAPYYQPPAGGAAPVLQAPIVTPGSPAPLGSTGGWTPAGSSKSSASAAEVAPASNGFRANSGGVVQIDDQVRSASAQLPAESPDGTETPTASPAPTPAASKSPSGPLSNGGSGTIRIPAEVESSESSPPTAAGVTPTSFRMTLPSPTTPSIAPQPTPVDAGALRDITDLPPARADRSIRDSRAFDRLYR